MVEKMCLYIISPFIYSLLERQTENPLSAAAEQDVSIDQNKNQILTVVGIHQHKGGKSDTSDTPKKSWSINGVPSEYRWSIVGVPLKYHWSIIGVE